MVEVKKEDMKVEADGVKTDGLDLPQFLKRLEEKEAKEMKDQQDACEQKPVAEKE